MPFRNFPVLVPGQKVVLELRDELDSGQAVLMTVVASEDCQEDGEWHVSTICPKCARSWAVDWRIGVVVATLPAGSV